jgi:putative SOS response-associated peptidase YedK
MCGRATLSVPAEDIREVFDLEEVPDLGPARYNIAPSLPLPIIRTPGKLEMVRWGDKGFINAKVERATTRPELRCLVVIDGFYEWRHDDRQPFYFHRADGKPFAVGGVLRSSGEACAIVTCPPADLVADIHDRMPLILEKEAWAKWLAGQRPSASVAGFERYAVSTVVNNPRNESAECIRRIDDPGPPIGNLFQRRDKH